MQLLKSMLGIAMAAGLMMGCGGPVPADSGAAPQGTQEPTGEVTAQAPPCSFCESQCDTYGWESTTCTRCWGYCIDYLTAEQ